MNIKNVKRKMGDEVSATGIEIKIESYYKAFRHNIEARANDTMTRARNNKHRHLYRVVEISLNVFILSIFLCRNMNDF